jgi:hypothetical protein
MGKLDTVLGSVQGNRVGCVSFFIFSSSILCNSTTEFWRWFRLTCDERRKVFPRLRLRVVSRVDVPSSSLPPQPESFRPRSAMLIRPRRLFSLPAYEIVAIDIGNLFFFFCSFFFSLLILSHFCCHQIDKHGSQADGDGLGKQLTNVIGFFPQVVATQSYLTKNKFYF